MKMYAGYIVDDYGYHWYYSDERCKIICIEAECELLNDSDCDEEEILENGYYCYDLEEGKELLIDYGYITE
jgi:hypothetical protein